MVLQAENWVFQVGAKCRHLAYGAERFYQNAQEGRVRFFLAWLLRCSRRHSGGCTSNRSLRQLS